MTSFIRKSPRPSTPSTGGSWKRSKSTKWIGCAGPLARSLPQRAKCVRFPTSRTTQCCAGPKSSESVITKQPRRFVRADDAPADWWAEIITRFHQDVGGGIVLTDESVRPDVVRKLAKAGKSFTAPTFDDSKSSVSFLLLDPEAYIVYSVKATRIPSGKVEVVKTRLLSKTSDGKQPKRAETTIDPREKIGQGLR